jgi:hypothetical protein
MVEKKGVFAGSKDGTYKSMFRTNDSNSFSDRVFFAGFGKNRPAPRCSQQEFVASRSFFRILGLFRTLSPCSLTAFFQKNTMKQSLAIAISTVGLATLLLAGCSAPEEKWEKSPGVEITVDKEYINGKPFLTVFYENYGADTIEKIRYELITNTKGRLDTAIREIDPPVLLRPKDRHVVPRHIGEDTVTADEVRAGQVWVVKR